MTSPVTYASRACIAVLILAASLLAACGGSSGSGARTGAFPVGKSKHTLTIDGSERDFNVYRPKQLRDPAPLVVFLHGGLGSADHAEQAYGWDQLADSQHFVVAYPNGPRAWNAGDGCCGEPGKTDRDDVLFITKVVATVEEHLTIDRNRIYASGFSNGAMMDYRLACETKDVFAAIGPVAGTELVRCNNPQPLSIIHIHGLDDPIVRFDGGPGSGASEIDGPPIPSILAAWRKTDDCGAPSESKDGPVTTSVAICADGRAVELVTIAGAGHQYPGAGSTEGDATAPSTAIDATKVIWAFFEAHPRK